jgi:hypothetical protein
LENAIEKGVDETEDEKSFEANANEEENDEHEDHVEFLYQNIYHTHEVQQNEEEHILQAANEVALHREMCDKMAEWLMAAIHSP